ncbi:putative short-chain dehydrogenase [Corynascus similis CBS 632.67]
MPSTSHAEFNGQTEALEVAQTFADLIRGKTIIITGVNPLGIGMATAEAFASQSPAHLIITGRTRSKLEESINALKVKFPDVNYRLLEMDLSKQRSVRVGAAEVLAWSDVPTVDILVNNAGVALLPKRTLSEDGIELTFATNHVGHFLFTNLIMPKLIRAAAQAQDNGTTRIINVTSGSPRWGGMRWSDMSFDRPSAELPEEERPNLALLKAWGIITPGDNGENLSYIPLEAYNQSKVANLLFSVGLTQRLHNRHGILGLAAHPGVVMRTELGRSAGGELWDEVAERAGSSVKTLGAGAATTLVAALNPKLNRRPGDSVEKDNGKENYGAYLVDCQISDTANPRAVSTTEAEKLWELSEKLVGEKFSW